MDLKALISKATQMSQPTPTSEIPIIPVPTPKGPQPKAADNPMCVCGHPHDAHDDGQECNILECECTAFSEKLSFAALMDKVDERLSKPVSALFTNASIPQSDVNCKCGHAMTAHGWTGPVVSGCTECKCSKFIAAARCPNCEEAPCKTPDACKQDIAEAQAKKSGKMTFKIPAGLASQIKLASSDIEETPPQPVDLEQDAVIEDKTKCKHLCENPDCKKWWSHGDVDKCRYPDLISQGLCLSCLNGATNDDPTADFVDGKFTVAAGVKIRNTEREKVCKDMNVEQLTRHIAFLERQIEMLRIKSLETRKMRSEAEEAELENVPEEDREKFIQALRNGNKKTERKPRAKKVKDEVSPDPGVRLNAYEKSVINIMRRLNMTREQAEAFIND